ncbi:VOC family protein [Rhodococcus triatomae]|uniref:VOC domain-containing protein n=1 Tax=Rhodococcus triatomae TaxID=300028 RepID=A0A1G8GWA9_9NOCA|nr:VOC family protein [Rhodococcus triatomae]QNG20281.1 VOC family protein [Rhodococcus triatomae]QNG23804.1 VOC family protein [Rhodococcus triatomae]SDH98672.1 hypothetical protein SAMN05444695_104225 [Rhodococcus triatomae]
MSHRPDLVGAPCWVDLTSSDTDRAAEFYTGLFGWTAATDPDPQYGGYTMFSLRGEPIAGLGPRQPDNPYAEVWTVYLSVADAEATTTRAVDTGGQIVAPTMQIGDQGSMAILADSAGAIFGVWEAGGHTGFGLVDEPGAPVWHESYTRDFPRSKVFYSGVFGWSWVTLEDSDRFRYAQADLDGQPVAGLMDASRILPSGVPSFWQFYVGVDDTDAALRAVTELGGSVLRAPEDTPYGRLAAISDPLGSSLQIVSVTEGS